MLQIAKKHIGEPPKRFRDDLLDLRRLMIRDIQTLIIQEYLQQSIEAAQETEELEILTELQHYGGITNLIDFTTDYLVAIFFTCAGDPREEGRVIVLQKTEQIEKMMIRPRNPQHRVIVQKSVFLHPPTGLIDVTEDDMVKIPATLKEAFRKYLEKYHHISAETIYNDIHGFIRYQEVYQNVYLQYYAGLTLHFRAFNTESLEERQRESEKAIRHYSEAINLKPDFDEAYYNRGECWLYLKEWSKATRDLTIAQDMGIDIASAFHNDYKDGIEGFKAKTGIELPKSIAVLFGY
jgi:tetratricopeptide (TPR) repeat protein